MDEKINLGAAEDIDGSKTMEEPTEIVKLLRYGEAWSPQTKYSEIRPFGTKYKCVYCWSCCNLAYECNEGDGINHLYQCGRDHCNCSSFFLCCCLCLCCWPCFMIPHRVRQCIGVDYSDFFGGPSYRRTPVNYPKSSPYADDTIVKNENYPVAVAEPPKQEQ